MEFVILFRMEFRRVGWTRKEWSKEMLEFIEQHRVLSVAMTDSIIGCPHQEGIDYEGEWCPACEFWHGRDRFTGQTVN